ncbi:hypothetical protein [Methanoculleus sp.]|uniref:hypothetical protein n=1 Tax=Methanoculleus sp. TaxID=90427 RepID=UPI00262308B2|nr:hypothetical protein [Methanoculleus sp.]MDD2253737.1 hypothetical protein [Methanoculleus sp.]MDD2788260.1 hypothetical protein [Methanoculleus sp.]
MLKRATASQGKTGNQPSTSQARYEERVEVVDRDVGSGRGRPRRRRERARRRED